MQKVINYFQEKVIFLPKKLNVKHVFSFPNSFEEYFFNTPNNGWINALHFKVENTKGVILYFHGNANNLEKWGNIASQYCEYQYDVFVFDYRGYGKSKGERNENNMFSDAQFCYDFLSSIYEEQEIVLFGRSLGGAIATKIASENQAKLLILESTFYNLQDMANRWLSNKVTNWFDSKVDYHFRSDQHIKNVKMPIFQFHGTSDLIVPIYSGKKLHEEILHSDKKFIEIIKGKHNNLAKFDLYNEEIQHILKDF